MANTQRLGSIWKGRAWDDGEQVPRLTLPDGTLAEAMAALNYGWDSGASVFRKMLVDSSGNQVITGTVTANAGTNLNTSALALDATLTGGTQKAIVRGGAKGATTAADVTSTAEGANNQALDVQIWSGGVAKDPTAIRALTTADAVNVGQWIGSAAPTVGSKTSANSVPVVIASDQGALPAIAAGTNRIGSVRVVDSADADQTAAKGTQTSRFLGTQDAKDSGRVNISWTAEFAFAQTAETLLTITESRDGAATTTFTTKVVTNGKRLRITSIGLEAESLGTGTTPQRCYLRMRFNTAGAVTTGSPLQGVYALGVTTAIVKASEKEAWAFPDGIEFLGDGTKQIGFSLETPDWVVTTATGRAKVTITAFEY